MSPLDDKNNKNSQGLSSKKAADLLEKNGYNLLPEPKSPTIFLIFFQQFLSPFIYILLVAGVISVFLNEASSAIFIFVVLLVNAAIGTTQEYSSMKAALALKKIVPKFVTVIRDGKAMQIPATHLVVGDLVIIRSGDKIGADIKLISSQNLTVDESILTGESLEVVKDAKKITDSDNIADQTHKIFAGTIAVKGRAKGIVQATAFDTQIGKISQTISDQNVAKPPLLLRIESFTKKITYLTIFLILLLILVFFFKGQPLVEIFFLSVALAIAAIPEGLPAAITVALSVGMRRMVSHNVIIRKLVATEGLGSCTFIASDKTGTLTINELTIQKILLPNNQTIPVQGQGLEIIKNNIDPKNEESLLNLSRAAILANESTIDIKDNKVVASQGDMVDISFLILGEKYGLEQEKIQQEYQQIANIPYESQNCYCASINSYQDKSYIFAKGSVEKLLELSTKMLLDGKEVKIDKTKILQQEQDLAKQGYRIIAVAQSQISHQELKNSQSNPQNLTFLGMVAMIDPIRNEAKEAIKSCKTANIKVAMITGDHPQTALAIAANCGIIDTNQTNKVVTGKELKEAAEKGQKYLDDIIDQSRVFARINPFQKKQIVQSLNNKGHFVAVTGDGVNDAPALKQANIGVAMGKKGSDVAKEAADIILTDDNFASIVAGIKQGRVIYNNIRKVIFLLMTTGFAEIILFLLSILFNLPMPLIAVQLLWLNLVTNGVQDVALGFEPEEGNELQKPPRDPKERIFNKIMIKRLLIDGFLIGVLAFLTFKFFLEMGRSTEEARNMTLLLMVLFENIQALNSRSETRSTFQIRLFANPFLIISIIGAHLLHIGAMYIPSLSNILQISPISFNDWLLLFFIAAILFIIDEIFKLKQRIYEKTRK